MEKLKRIYKIVSSQIKLPKGKQFYSISDLHNGKYLIWVGNIDTEIPIDPAVTITYLYDIKKDEIEELITLFAFDIVRKCKNSTNVRISDLLEEAV